MLRQCWKNNLKDTCTSAFSKNILKICIAVAKWPAQFSTIIKNFYKLSRKQKTPSLYHHKSILKQNNPVQRIHPDSSDNFHAQSACVLKLCLLGKGCGPYLNKLESCFVPSLVDICPTVLGKKNLKFCQCIYFCFIIIISAWKRELVVLHLNKHESP